MKKAIPLFAILLVASTPLVRTAAQTSATAETQKAGIAPEQAASIQKIPADAKPEAYGTHYCAL